MESTVGIVILAAGLGKRMKSDKAKVLHEVAGRPMIDYIVGTAVQVAGSNVVVVVGYQAELVREAVSRLYPVHYAVQAEQRGTGHAVACAMPAMPTTVNSIVIMCGDVPLIRAATIEQLVADHLAHRRDATILAVRVPDPSGYGRVVMDRSGRLTAIVEQADADDSQKTINIINTGFYVIERSFLEFALPQLSPDNAQNEIYLTDIIGLGHRHQRTIGAMIGANAEEVMGINSQSELKIAEKIMNIGRYEKS